MKQNDLPEISHIRVPKVIEFHSEIKDHDFRNPRWRHIKMYNFPKSSDFREVSLSMFSKAFDFDYKDKNLKF